MLKLLMTLSLVAYVACAGAAAQTNDKPAAPMKFFIFREDCFNKFEKMDFSDQDCLKFTLSKAIGFAIIVGSGIVKVP